MKAKPKPGCNVGGRYAGPVGWNQLPAERRGPGGWVGAMAARHTRARGTGCHRQNATTPERAMPREGSSTALPGTRHQRAVSRERAMTQQGETAGVGGLPTCASLSRRHRIWRQGDMPVGRTPARGWRGLQRQRARTLQDGTPREDRVAALPRPPPPATSDGRRIPRNQKGYAVRGTV